MNYIKNHKLLAVSGFVLVLIILKTNLLHDLLLFVLVGAVPGFEISVPPIFMALGVVITSLLVVLSLVFKIKSLVEERAAKPISHQLPRRRYAEEI